jgi:hypothetical protein
MDDPVYISTLALLVSILAIGISFTALTRDRHKVHVYGAAFEDPPNTWNLSITAANAGKRPISMSFVRVHRGGKPVQWLPFSEDGTSKKIEVGDSVTMNIPPKYWSNLSELNECTVTVQDALGKRYPVPGFTYWSRLARAALGG